MIQFQLPEKPLYNYPYEKERIKDVILTGCLGYFVVDDGASHNKVRDLGFTIMGPLWIQHLLDMKVGRVDELKLKLEAERSEPGRRLLQWDIDFKQLEVDVFQYVEVPLAVALQEYRDHDTDCDYYQENEKKDRCAPTWVKGKPSTTENLKLKPGDRFINMHTMQKYVFVRQTGTDRGLMYPGSFTAIDECTRREKNHKDYELFLKLPGQGDIENIAIPAFKMVMAPTVPAEPIERHTMDKRGQLLIF